MNTNNRQQGRNLSGFLVIPPGMSQNPLNFTLPRLSQFFARNPNLSGQRPNYRHIQSPRTPVVQPIPAGSPGFAVFVPPVRQMFRVWGLYPEHIRKIFSPAGVITPEIAPAISQEPATSILIDGPAPSVLIEDDEPVVSTASKLPLNWSGVNQMVNIDSSSDNSSNSETIEDFRCGYCHEIFGSREAFGRHQNVHKFERGKRMIRSTIDVDDLEEITSVKVEEIAPVQAPAGSPAESSVLAVAVPWERKRARTNRRARKAAKGVEPAEVDTEVDLELRLGLGPCFLIK